MGAPNTSGSDALATRHAHTPLPWKVNRQQTQSNWPGRGFSAIVSASTVIPIIAHGDTAEEAEANAAIIVRAVNSFEDMLSALKAQEMRDSGQPNPFGHNCIWCTNCCNKVEEMRRAAIAKAERGQ